MVRVGRMTRFRSARRLGADESGLALSGRSGRRHLGYPPRLRAFLETAVDALLSPPKAFRQDVRTNVPRPSPSKNANRTDATAGPERVNVADEREPAGAFSPVGTKLKTSPSHAVSGTR